MKIVKRIGWAVLAILVLVGAFFYYEFKTKGSVPKEVQDPIVHVPTGASYEQVLDTLKAHGIVLNEAMFHYLADYMKYKKPEMRSGRFKVEPGMTYVELIRMLRNGKQEPLDMVLTNERQTENVAAKIARFVESDSVAFYNLFNDTMYLDSIGYTKETLMSLFIPNSYQVFWNSAPRKVMERLLKEHDAFWGKENRLAKAQALQMTPAEVYTLASIVEKETNQNSEKQRMAGVYLNRIRDGWPLQADPTLVFATKDFMTKRVTDYHKYFESPYNTYMNKGLPPGPIAMASIASIDAVLNREDHNYFFFCAKGDNSGLHSFAETLSGHNVNVDLYMQRMRESGYWNN